MTPPSADDSDFTDTPPNPLIRLDGPAQQFSLSKAQRTLPEGILREIGYYGGAGGGSGNDCSVWTEGPGVLSSTAAAEWWNSVTFALCGFGFDEPVTMAVISPQGETVREETKSDKDSFGGVYFSHTPELNDPLGIYTARFSNASGSVEQSFEVIRPDGPRVYWRDGRIVLFQFEPNETVRLFAYEPMLISDSSLVFDVSREAYSLSSWNEFVTDAEGQLIVEGFPDSVLAVVGQQSGESEIVTDVRLPLSVTSPYAATVMRPTDEEMSEVVDIWTLTQFHDLDRPGEQRSEITVSAADPLYWRMRWCAANSDILRQNLSGRTLVMRFIINGVDVEAFQLRKTEETHPNTGWACHRWGTILRDLPTESPTTLVIEYELTQDVNDGRQVYPAGTYRQIITVHATEDPTYAGEGTGQQTALAGEPYAPPPAEYVLFEPAADAPPPDNVRATIDQFRPKGFIIDESETDNGPLIAASSPTTLEPAPSLGPEFWLDLYVLTCAWPVASEYAVTIEYPDGRTELERLNVDRSATCEPYTTSLFDPLLGTYTIQFGTYENMRHTIEVVAPSGPRLYVFHEGNQGSTSLLLHHFAPNEAVHLYEYKPDEQAPGTLRLAGWQALQTDDNGQLLTGTRHCRSEICMSQPGAYIPTLVVVGDTSGEVHEFDQLYFGAAVGSILIEE